MAIVSKKDAWLLVENIDNAGAIWDPIALIAQGFTPELVEETTEILKVDLTNPKATVYVEGKLTNHLRGVLAMTLAENICDGLGIEYESAWGWQRTLQNMKDAIETRWGKSNAEEPL